MLSLNGTELKFDTYPNGEQKVPRLHTLVKPGERQEIFFRWDGDVDLVRLLFVLSYLSQHRIEAHLEIAYMPYSRMDRLEGGPEWEKAEATSLLAVIRMLQGASLNYGVGSPITVWDPHSDFTAQWLNATPVYPAKEMFLPLARQVGFNPVQDYIVLPDKGAVDRYLGERGEQSIIDGFGGFFNIVALEKKRNYDTGQIEHIGFDEHAVFPRWVEGESRQAIILDDLCSYGGTFIKASELLRDAGFDKVHLLVTHLEASCLKGKLFDHVDTVWGSDSLMDPLKRQKKTDKLYIYSKEEWKK